MSSDEERLEEMLKAVMETENTTQPVQNTAEEEEIPAPEIPEIGEDLLDMPLEEIPDISLEEIPDISLEEIPDISLEEMPDMPLEEIPDIPLDDMSDVPTEEMPKFSAEDVLKEAGEKAPDLREETLAEPAKGEKAEKPTELPQEMREKEMAVDPMAFLSMSEEEIDKVLEEEAASAEVSSEKSDRGKLPDLLDGNDDLEDIQKLLRMSDTHEQVDDSRGSKDTVLKSVETEARNSSDEMSDDGEESSEEPQKKLANGTDRKKEKRKKEKKKKVNKEEKKKENKEGFGKKLAAFFFSSDEDELEEADAGSEKQKESGADAKEGAAVKGRKKKEKKKKEPKKKEPDPKKAAKEKQQKAKNAEKAKKKAEKAEKAEKEKRAAKKLPKKKVIVWVIFCASIGAGILLMNSVGMSTLQLTEARNAFDEKDYETAYRLLNGRELSEEDQLRFRQSSAMLHLEHAEEAYGNHLKLNKPVVALEDLLRGVGKYQELQQAGESELITPEVTAQYQRILDILQENYSLTENGVLEINALDSDYEYSLQLEALVNGEIYQSQADMESEQEEEATAYPELEDILPEEEEYLNGSSD